jgi:hypothetical protein
VSRNFKKLRRLCGGGFELDIRDSFGGATNE